MLTTRRAMTISLMLAIAGVMGAVLGLGLATYNLLNPPPPPLLAPPPGPGMVVGVGVGAGVGPPGAARAVFATNQQLAASAARSMRSAVRNSALAAIGSLAVLVVVVLSSRWKRLDEWWTTRQVARWQAHAATRPAARLGRKLFTGASLVFAAIAFTVAQAVLAYDAYRLLSPSSLSFPSVANLSTAGSSIAAAAMLWSLVALTVLVFARTLARPPHLTPGLCTHCLYDRAGLDAEAVCPECGKR